jgi:hypothetical protein
MPRTFSSTPGPGLWRLLVLVSMVAGLLAVPPGAAGAQENDPGLEPIGIEGVCPAPSVGGPTFGDIAGDTFDTEIRCLALAEITRGVREGVYAPGLNVSREQMASFIASLIDTSAELATEGSPVAALPAYDGTNRFVDVRADNVHVANINRLAEAGIVLGGPGGIPADRYGPGQAVSRAQMASFVARGLSYLVDEALTSDTDHFVDDDGNIHEPAINVVADLGVAVGVGDRRFEPHGAISRGQMAAFLVRSLAVLEARGHITPLPVDEVPETFLPVVFVHGGSGSAQQFQSQALRFTSNGYPQELLFA